MGNVGVKDRQVSALVDTGAQLSCIRSDVAEFLYTKEKPCVFSSCSLSCLLADGQQCDVAGAEKLHVKLLSYSWDHKFKVLIEDRFLPFWDWILWTAPGFW